jgi:hypothetical protein
MNIKTVLVLILGVLTYMFTVGVWVLSDDQIYDQQFFGCVGRWRPFPKLTGYGAVPGRVLGGMFVFIFALNYTYRRWVHAGGKSPSFQKLSAFVILGVAAVFVFGFNNCSSMQCKDEANSAFHGVKQTSGPFSIIQPDISGKKVRAAAGQSAVADDPWEFVKYVPSSLETKWMSNIEEWQKDICKYSVTDKAQTKQFDEWIKITSATAPVAEIPHEIFSKFMYKTKRSQKFKSVYIEPLATVLRHPHYCQEYLRNNNFGRPVVLRKDWLYISWSIGEQLLSAGRDARLYYFDAGASLWNHGGGGASQRWFYKVRGLQVQPV